MSDAATRAAAALGADGPFVSRLPGFAPRVDQQAMAAEVAEVLAGRETLVCEAGTGTGKTFAYLVPALLSGLRTIVSTATRTLQDQLFHRDLPVVRDALGLGLDAALLKGRQNYACLYRLERAAGSPELDPRRQALVERVRAWAPYSTSGDLEEVPELDDDAGLRHLVTSTVDNCLGQECPVYENCFVVRARRAASQADLVVVNHHLLFADMVLRETGFAELLPSAEAIVLDEAHKVPDIASTFFSRSLSGQQLVHLVRDVGEAAGEEAPDMPDLVQAVHALEVAREAFTRALSGVAVGPQRRLDWVTHGARPEIAVQIGALGDALGELATRLEAAAGRGPALENCFERLLGAAGTLSLFTDGTEPGHVRWAEATGRGFALHDTPVRIANEFSARLEASDAAWVLTSATLAIDGRFDHFCQALGIREARERLWQSPFDYAANSLLYVPPLGREPRAEGFEDELMDAVLPVIRAAGGRTFFLFTSYRALTLCAERLRHELEFPLLVQGEAPRSDLLRRFEALGNAVLLGTATFWEGVDVRGEALSCVIIDKLPFGVPDDPVARARGEACAAEGGNPFAELQLPEAVTALKQGAGRLIRDVSDRGVLVIGDVRIRRRGYGRTFVNSLPPMPFTDQVEDVRRFFAAAQPANGNASGTSQTDRAPTRTVSGPPNRR